MGQRHCHGDQSAKLEEQVLERLGVANLAGAAVALLTGIITNPGNEPVAHQMLGSASAFDIAAFAVVMALALPLGAVISRRVLRRGCGQGDVLAVPWKLTSVSFAMWSAAAAVFGSLNWVGHHSPLLVVKVVGEIALGGVATCGITFLLVERALRPLFAVALAREASTRHRTLGVRSRLLLAWVLGSGVPLLMFALAFAGPDSASTRHPGWTVAFLVATGIVTGALVTWVTARSLAEPIEKIRIALGRVQVDDLDVRVDVDDAGETGQLQAGVNRMVDGLRERRRLVDLFGRHVGPEVARLALEEGDQLGGQRREVSVLFIDLIGSSRLAETRPPDAVVEVLNQLFDAVVHRVAAEGGWVNKFEGDGALCVFGAPVSQADHADRALRAARTLHRDILLLAAVQPGLDAAIGVSSGLVVAGNVGAAQRYEYTVIGDPVNEAARLTDEAKKQLSRVLASDETIQRADRERGRWQVLDELALRGRTHPTLAHCPRPGADDLAQSIPSSDDSQRPR